MRNKYKGICYYCGKTVEVGDGHFERHDEDSFIPKTKLFYGESKNNGEWD